MPVPLALIAGLGAASVGGNLLSGWMGSSAADRASRRQSEAIQKGLDLQKQIYDQTRSDYLPYVQAGLGGLTKYQAALDNFQAPTLGYVQKDFQFDTFKDPGAQYRMEQAMKAINSSAAAKGGMGGGVLRNLQKESQNMASQEYANAYDRWLKDSGMRYGQASDQYTREMNAKMVPMTGYSDIAKMGSGTVANLARVGDQYSTGAGNLYGSMGSAQAAGALGSSNAWSNAMGNILSDAGKLAGTYYGSQYDPNTKGYQTDFNQFGARQGNVA